MTSTAYQPKHLRPGADENRGSVRVLDVLAEKICEHASASLEHTLLSAEHARNAELLADRLRKSLKRLTDGR